MFVSKIWISSILLGPETRILTLGHLCCAIIIEAVILTASITLVNHSALWIVSLTPLHKALCSVVISCLPLKQLIVGLNSRWSLK